MKKNFVIDEKEYCIARVNEITLDNKQVGLDLEGEAFTLDVSHLEDTALLRKIKKGDEIIYTVDKNCVGIQEVFLPIYRMND